MIRTHEVPRELTTRELLDPRRTPEAGFQSYEWFTNNATAQKTAFLSGEVRNPQLRYSQFEHVDRLDVAIANLDYVKDQIWQREHVDIYRIIAPSLTFRQIEMMYVKETAELNDLVRSGVDGSEVQVLADHLRQMNEILYGTPDQTVLDGAYNKLWGMIDGKELHPSAQCFKDDLLNGFTFEGKTCAPLGRAKNPEVELPEYADNAALEWFGEIVLEANADIREAVDAFWAQKVAEHGPGYVCGPEDIAEIFQAVIHMRHLDERSGVAVQLKEGKTALSWESPEVSVHVGLDRVPIKTTDELFSKILHELAKHGQACVEGLETDIPVLGTGLYTETERPDYLSFEEGVATTAEEVVGDDLPKWTVVMLGHYINIAEARENGHDFRETFEKAWRYRLLAQIKAGQEVTQDIINKHKSAAYTACVRIFRGTPIDIQEKCPDITPLTFNKDLAYLNGRVLALQYISECHERNDEEAIKMLFRGKYDPTIPEQREIADRFLRKQATD